MSGNNKEGKKYFYEILQECECFYSKSESFKKSCQGFRNNFSANCKIYARKVHTQSRRPGSTIVIEGVPNLTLFPFATHLHDTAGQCG